MEHLPCVQNFYNKNLKGKDHWEHLMCRWEDNVKWDHKESRWGLLDWIYPAEDRDQFQTLVNVAVSSSNESDEFLG